MPGRGYLGPLARASRRKKGRGLHPLSQTLLCLPQLLPQWPTSKQWCPRRMMDPHSLPTSLFLPQGLGSISPTSLSLFKFSCINSVQLNLFGLVRQERIVSKCLEFELMEGYRPFELCSCERDSLAEASGRDLR